MDAVLGWLWPILQNLPGYVSAIDAVLVALIALCLLIPGEQPEKALRAAADWLAQFSKK